MHKKPTQKPRLIRVVDCRRDDLTPPRLAQELIDGDRAALRATTVREDLQATRRRPLDAPMATRAADPWSDSTDYDMSRVVPSLGIGRLVLHALLLVVAFVAGLAVGRVA